MPRYTPATVYLTKILFLIKGRSTRSINRLSCSAIRKRTCYTQSCWYPEGSAEADDQVSRSRSWG